MKTFIFCLLFLVFTFLLSLPGVAQSAGSSGDTITLETVYGESNWVTEVPVQRTLILPTDLFGLDTNHSPCSFSVVSFAKEISANTAEMKINILMSELNKSFIRRFTVRRDKMNVFSFKVKTDRCGTNVFHIKAYYNSSNDDR